MAAPVSSHLFSGTRWAAPRHRLLGLLGVLAIGLGACATAVPAGPTVGDLEVVNPSALPFELSIDGQSEGTIAPASRRLIRYVPMGTRRVVFRAPQGPEDVQAIDIAPQATTTWIIATDDARDAPLPPPLSTLSVRNTLRQPINLRLSGSSVGRVLPGETRTFRGLIGAEYHTEALPDGGGAPVVTLLTLVPGTTLDWTVSEQGSAVTVDNTTTEALFISVDGRSVGRVPPNDQSSFIVSPSLHAFSAVSEPSRRRYESNIDTRAEALSEGAPVWTVAQGSARLTVKNDTPEDLTVVAGESPAKVVAPGASESFDELPSGGLAVRATSASGQVHLAHYEVAAKDRITWSVRPFDASIRVQNTLNNPITLYGGSGAKGKVLLGKIAPKSAVAINGLRPSEYHLEAFDIQGAQSFETTLDLTAEGAATWEIRSETASLRISNHKRERVLVKLDGGDFAELAPDEVRIATGLAPGPHLVEAIGVVSGAKRSQKLRLQAEESHDVTFGDEVAHIQLSNRTGEAILPLGPLRPQSDSLPVNGEHDFLLAPGPHALRFLGRDTGAIYKVAVDLASGERQEVRVERTYAHLKLVNGLAESVVVARDGNVLATIEPLATHTFDNLTPGRCELQLVGLTSGRFRTLKANLPPGGIEHLRIDPIGAVILIENRSPQDADIYLGKTLLGTANANKIAAFGNIAAGPHELSVAFHDSKRALTQAVTLEEGERRVVIAELPEGSVLIENTSREPLSIRIDRATPIEIAADTSRTWLTVPVGSRRVEVTYRDSSLTDTFQLQVNADSVSHVAAFARRARLVLVNQHDAALEVFDGEHLLATLAAQSSAMLEDLRPGELHMRAQTKAGLITHSGPLSLRPGQTGTWVMVPLPLPSLDL